MSIKQQATKSVFWSAIERFSVQGIQFLLSLIIARLLLPSDYGLIAMLSIFMAIAQTFIDSGFANALIQKKNKTDADYSTVFFFNIVISVFLYVLLYLSSSAIAGFYHEKELESITKVFGIILIINSFGIVQQAKLTILLDFKRLAMASLTSVVISGVVGVIMACKGFGAWALVWQSLLNNLLRVLLIWLFSGWMPSFCFSSKSFKQLFSFGSKLLLSSLLHTIYTNLYTMIIGLKFSAGELGFYNRAFTLAQFPSTNLTNVIVRAIYPIQCRLQDDNEQLYSMFLKYMRMACFLIFPVMICLCALAEPLIRLLLTDKWLPAVPLLQLLCMAYMWDPVMKINHNILNVKGRSDYFLYAEILKKIIAFLILFLTIPFGIKVMCVGLIIYSFADIIIITYYTRKLIDISLYVQFKTLFPVILLSFSMGVVMYGCVLIFQSVWLQLFIGIISGGFYFMGLSCYFRFQEFNILKDIIFRKTKK